MTQDERIKLCVAVASNAPDFGWPDKFFGDRVKAALDLIDEALLDKQQKHNSSKKDNAVLRQKIKNGQVIKINDQLFENGNGTRVEFQSESRNCDRVTRFELCEYKNAKQSDKTGAAYKFKDLSDKEMSIPTKNWLPVDVKSMTLAKIVSPYASRTSADHLQFFKKYGVDASNIMDVLTELLQDRCHLPVHAYQKGLSKNSIRLIYQVPLVIKQPNNFNTKYHKYSNC